MAYCGPRGIPHSEFLSWPLDDQAKALGWMAEDAQKCSECGTADWEWMEDPNAYHAGPHVCRGCTAVAVARQEYASYAGKVSGLKIQLLKGGGVDGGS